VHKVVVALEDYFLFRGFSVFNVEDLDEGLGGLLRDGAGRSEKAP